MVRQPRQQEYRRIRSASHECPPGHVAIREPFPTSFRTPALILDGLYALEIGQEWMSI
jgi:hypothetical protein